MFNLPDSTLKSAEERRQIFLLGGVDLSRDIIMTCQSGVTATVGFASIKDITKASVRMYDGSWGEYYLKN